MHHRAALLVLSCLLSQACATTRGPETASFPPPDPCEAFDRLTDTEVADRLRYIDVALGAARGPTRAWFTTWLSLLGAASVGQITLLAAVPDRELKIDAAVGAVGTVVAIVPLVLSPRHALGAADTFAVDRLEETDGNARARLCRAEKLLEEAAKDATGGASWVAHVAGDGAAIVLGLVQWLAFHHPYPGAFTAVAGTVGNEFLVLTQPTGVADAWDNYRTAFRHEFVATAQPPRWHVDVAPGHMALRLDF